MSEDTCIPDYLDKPTIENLQKRIRDIEAANYKEQNSLRVKLTMMEVERDTIANTVELIIKTMCEYGPKHSPLHPSN